MAQEISVAAKPGVSIYALILNTVGEVWNPLLLGFESMVDTIWADYALGLIEQGNSGLYLADFPLVPAGLYSVVAYQMGGDDPAPSDGPPIGSPGRMDWSGAKEVSFNDVLVALEEAGDGAGVSDPYLLSRIYGSVDPLDAEGRQVFRDPVSGVPKVRLGPTTPRGGRTVELDPEIA